MAYYTRGEQGQPYKRAFGNLTGGAGSDKYFLNRAPSIEALSRSVEQGARANHGA